MLDVSEKLKKFSTEVLSEANEISQKKWEDFIEKQRLEYDKEETKYLEEGYNYIQNGLKQIDKEKSSQLSKAIMEHRQKVLRKRVEIVEEVFADVTKKLKDYMKTDAYRELLEKRIAKTLSELGDGKKKIVLSFQEENKISELQNKFKDVIFEVESKQSKQTMIGGCYGYHPENNMFYDYSFLRQIREQKEKFLQGMGKDLKIEE